MECFGLGYLMLASFLTWGEMLLASGPGYYRVTNAQCKNPDTKKRNLVTEALKMALGPCAAGYMQIFSPPTNPSKLYSREFFLEQVLIVSTSIGVCCLHCKQRPTHIYGRSHQKGYLQKARPLYP